TGAATKCRRPNTNRNRQHFRTCGLLKRGQYSLYVEGAAEGPNEADGPFSATYARSLSEKARMTPLTKRLPLRCSRSERGLCPRNRILGGRFGRGAMPPSECPSGGRGPRGARGSCGRA